MPPKVIVSVHYVASEIKTNFGTEAGIPVLSAVVNGHVGRFAFDTGTTETLVTDAFARRAGLYGPSPIVLGIRRSREIAAASAPDPVQVQIGSLTFPGRVLTDTSVDLTRLMHCRIDGILGEQALETAAVLLSQTRRTLTFIAPGNLTAQERARIGMGDAAAVALHGTEDHLLSLLAVFRRNTMSTSEELVIDTGADTTIVSENAFRDLNGQVTAGDTLATVWGTEAEAAFAVDQAVLGPVTVDHPMLGYAADLKIQMPVVLGRDILSKFDLLIDAPAMTMYLSPSHAPPLPW